MSKRGHGRGAIAAIGLLVLFAGIVGGVILWIVAEREPDQTADGFARAAPGCTTTVTFSEAGEYYVYEELSGVVQTVEGCEPTTTPGQQFAFDVRPPGGQPVERTTDTSVSYDLEAGQGVSVARIVIDAPGNFAVSVLGNDPAVNAAIGDDPDSGVDELRRAAIASIAVGVVLGVVLLWLAGRRSRKAATFAPPIGPGWGITERDRERRATTDDSEWAAPVGPGQTPVNPHMPDGQRVADRGDDERTPLSDPELPEPTLPGGMASKSDEPDPEPAGGDGDDLNDHA